MNELVLITVGALVGAGVGWVIAHHIAIKAFANVISRLGIPEHKLEALLDDIRENGYQEEEDSIPLEHTLTVRVEQHGGVLYAYNDETEQYIGQHTDPEELIETISQSVPADTLVNIPINKGGIFFKDCAEKG